MRAIGQLPDEAGARAFGDYLVVQGLPNDIEPDDQGQWTVWIHEDDHLARAQELLEEFRRNPQDAKYRRVAPAARELREKEQKENASWAKRFYSRRSLWQGASWRIGGLTAALVAVSVAVAALKLMRGAGDPLVLSLYISDPIRTMSDNLHVLPEVRSGELWRLITPIFLHSGGLHLLFNMMWLLDLGGMIEARQGWGRLALLVVVMAVLSNVGQYFWNGPAFGGMSGVVFGFFGYVWLRGKLDPRSGFFIDRTNVILMIVWFFACATGMIAHIANVAHGVGLGVGLLWGFLSARFSRGG